MNAMLSLLYLSGTSWAAEAAAEAAPAAHAGGAKGWMVGLAAAVVLPFALRWLSTSGLTALVNWQLGKVMDWLKKDSGDAAVEQFEADLLLSLVKLAQAKFPNDGLGPEREKMVVAFLCGKFPLFIGREAQVAELVRNAVEKEKQLLADIKAAALARQKALEDATAKKPTA